MNEIDKNVEFASYMLSDNTRDINDIKYILDKYEISLDYMNKYIRKHPKHVKIVELTAIRDSVRDRYIPKCKETIDLLQNMNKSAEELLSIARYAKLEEKMSSIVAGPGGSTVGYMEVEDRIKEMRKKAYELKALSELRMVGVGEDHR